MNGSLGGSASFRPLELLLPPPFAAFDGVAPALSLVLQGPCSESRGAFSSGSSSVDERACSFWMLAAGSLLSAAGLRNANSESEAAVVVVVVVVVVEEAVEGPS